MLIVGIILLILIGLILFIFFIRNKLYDDDKEQAKASGSAYKAIETLNQYYQFQKFQGKLTYSKRTTAQKYRSRDYAYEIFIKEVVLPNLDSFEDLIRIAQYNSSLYPSYLSQFLSIIPFANTKAEKDLCDEKKLTPCIDPKFCMELYYTYYYQEQSNKFEFSIEEIARAIEESKKINATRTTAQRERSQMSDRIRFLVLKRDCYTCQLCGKTAKEGAELEVDHIIPISKGGKTEMSNLQTLCKRCNRGKGNLLIDFDDSIFTAKFTKKSSPNYISLDKQNIITLNTCIQVQFVESGEIERYKLVRAEDVVPGDSEQNIISEDSPIGEALIGQREGSLVTIYPRSIDNKPNPSYQLRILKIE